MMLFATTEDNDLQTAVFAGGCFWCMEPPYDKLDGVVSTRVGYAGGHVDNPTYEQVSTGTTGHAEAVQIAFDPAKIGYEDLLEVFWSNIDPTVKNRQFCDAGSQYRTAIFYENDEQRRLADASKEKILKGGKIETVYTEIVPLDMFWEAEDYHQDYYQNHPWRYKSYHALSGRESRLKEIWNK